MNDNKNEYSFNIILIGSDYIGKSYLLNKYINNVYSNYFIYDNYLEYKTKNINIRDKKIKLNLYEIRYDYGSSLVSYPNLKKADGVFIMYDITFDLSFLDAKDILKSIDEYLGEDSKKCKVLIACKSDDYNRQVTEIQGKNLGNEYHIPFFETSAKNNTNIQEMFIFLANKILRLKENESF